MRQCIEICIFFNIAFFSTFFLLIISYYNNRGDTIRKNIGVIILSILLALVFTKAMFTSYREEQVMTSDGNIYLLQYGSFINRDVMNENIKKLSNYLVYEHDNKYYVHLGVFTRLNTAKKYQKILENENIYTYIKNDYLGNSELINKINKLDNELYEEKKLNKIQEINTKILDLLKNSVY